MRQGIVTIALFVGLLLVIFGDLIWGSQPGDRGNSRWFDMSVFQDPFAVAVAGIGAVLIAFVIYVDYKNDKS